MTENEKKRVEKGGKGSRWRAGKERNERKDKGFRKRIQWGEREVLCVPGKGNVALPRKEYTGPEKDEAFFLGG